MCGTSSHDLFPEKDSNTATGKSLTRNWTMKAALEQHQLVGREGAMSEVIKLIREEGDRLHVISVWGMGGMGKTTLVRSVYGSEELSGMFQKRAWVTILHPFNREQFFRSLAMQLHSDDTGKDVSLMGDGTEKRLQVMEIADLIKETFRLLDRLTYLIVLDDLSSNTEWDSIIPHFPKDEMTSRIIITTREASVASRCSKKYKLRSLGDDAALDLFKKKV
ncbi:unnamed protein product [Triticum turgidum subsp. durum]|nr:unnamed protein product [Triticum turgidum subsp. durum]